MVKEIIKITKNNVKNINGKRNIMKVKSMKEKKMKKDTKIIREKNTTEKKKEITKTDVAVI